MNRKKSAILFLSSVMMMVAACNSGDKAKDTSSPATGNNTAAGSETASTKGIGPHQNVQLTHPLDQGMLTTGQKVYEVKCQSCHKLTDEKLVGPGWKGVTDRRTPEWILNFVTNVDVMIEKDPAAQKLLEECLVRMPNQNLTENDARSVLEFMRRNDGKN